MTVDQGTSPTAAVADRRGLTAAGAVLLVLALGLAGGAYDLSTGSGLGLAFAACFVTGCALAAALVHREDLTAAVILPPLAYVVLALGAGAVSGGAGSGSLLVRQGLELFNTLVLGAPVLAGATVLSLVIALGRWLAGRRSGSR